MEERAQHITGERLRAIENLIELEWSGLRRVHEDAVRELRDHAQALSQISIAATNSSIAGLERAEARLSEIEGSLQDRMAVLSEQLAAVVSEMRSRTSGQSGSGASDGHPSAAGAVQVFAWPVPHVGIPAPPHRPPPVAETLREHPTHREEPEPPAREPLPSPDVLLARLASLEDKMVARDAALHVAVERGDRARRLLKITAAVGIVLLLPAAVTGWLAAARARDAAGRTRAAMAAAEQQVAAARDEAARQAEAARESGARTQKLGEVLAAPDLIRYNVTGVDQYETEGQLLWSRSRGVVFTALRVPSLGADVTYQLWLLTDEASVAVGTFTPDLSGRVTLASDPPRSPRPVVGAAITIEPLGGSPQPSTRVLASTVLGP